MGEEVETPEGKGSVTEINVLLDTVTVEIESKGKVTFPIRNFLEDSIWNQYVEKLKEKKDDRFKCFTKAGVIGNESNQDT